MAQVDHVVHFYTGDAELVDSIAGFVEDAIRQGGNASVVASPEHVDQVARRLGPGLAAQVRFLDAAEALHTFDDGVELDHDEFDTAIGLPIRGTASTSGPVHVYGEMVALLWAAGRVADALELELMWNDLASTVPLSLLCGYPATALSRDEDAVSRLCGLHSATVGSTVTELHDRVATYRFSATVGAIRAARSFVVDQLREWGHEALVEDVGLVTSELATNAFVHAGTPFDVSVSSAAGVVRVAVSDASREAAVPRGPTTPRATSGRGLLVVAALASRWNSEIGPRGKTVWAEFAC